MGRTLDFYDKVNEAGNDDGDEISIHDELLLVLRCFQLYVGLHCNLHCIVDERLNFSGARHPPQDFIP